MSPPIRTRPSFPLSQSLPAGSFHKPLILLHQRVMGLVNLKTQENCLAPFGSNNTHLSIVLVLVYSLSCGQLSAMPWTLTSKAPLSVGFSRQEYWGQLPFPSPQDHVLSVLSTMICLSWVALQGIGHSFIELDKAVVHMICLVSFL